MYKINLPEHVHYIIEKLNNSGYEAYAVGGCVRDSIMGKIPNDWDITTSASPEQVKKLFPKTIDTGIKHGTVTIMLDKLPYEVTTYRIDGDYQDHRKPEIVTFTTDLVEDLKRRDFTMNAMAYNDREGLVDIFGGLDSINNKMISCVGNPNERFNEDALRMLRAIRFSAKLGFEIDNKTQNAIKNQAKLIESISGERIHMEMTKILISDNPHYIEKLCTLDLMPYVIPEFMVNVGLNQDNKHHIYTVDKHIYEALRHVKASEGLRWTILLHDIGKGYCKTIDDKGEGHFYGHPEKSVELSKEILNRLRFDNKTLKDILKLIEYHDYPINVTLKSVRKAVQKIGKELFLSFIEIKRADIMAQNPAYHVEYLAGIDNIIKLYNEMIELDQCTSLGDLKINGEVLKGLGLSEGRKIGEILNKLLESVIEEPELNTEEWLKAKALELIK